MTNNIINIGLPSKGRLKHDTINVFKKKKLNIYSERGERDLFGYIKKIYNIKIIYLHVPVMGSIFLLQMNKPIGHQNLNLSSSTYSEN